MAVDINSKIESVDPKEKFNFLLKSQKEDIIQAEDVIISGNDKKQEFDDWNADYNHIPLPKKSGFIANEQIFGIANENKFSEKKEVESNGMVLNSEFNENFDDVHDGIHHEKSRSDHVPSDDIKNYQNGYASSKRIIKPGELKAMRTVEVEKFKKGKEKKASGGCCDVM